MQEALTDNARGAEMHDFAELVEKVAKLPETEQEKICFFINGYMAAAATTAPAEKAAV